MSKYCFVLLLTLFVVCFAGYAGPQEAAKPGLWGVRFHSERFTLQNEKDVLTGVEHHWGNRRGNNWSARWGGFIEGPFTGEVTFTAEAIDGLRLKVSDTVIIDGLDINGPRMGKIAMEKGKKVPVVLEFTSNEGRARLHLYWSWEGQPRTIVPGSALSHNPNKMVEGLDIEGKSTFIFFPVQALGPGVIELSEAVIVASFTPIIRAKAADMLCDEILKRSRITLKASESMPAADVAAIVLGTVEDFPIGFKLPSGLTVPSRADGYAIWVDVKTRKAPTIYLIGRDERGALFAAGRLLRLLTMRRDILALSPDVQISTAPKYSLRGHQLGYRPKTNSYDAWNIEMWEQYYRDMVVFGTNAVELIPPKSDDDNDSPHFPEPKIKMMVKMSQLADDYGLDVWIWFPVIDRDHTYPETTEASMERWREVFQKLPRIDAVFVPGGDPGDTHPAVLLPLIQKQKKLMNRYHPKAQMWVSPQGFDLGGTNRDGWMKAFLDILQNQRPERLDGVVFGPQVEMTLADLRAQVPDRYPIRRYPDITHCRRCQYAVPNWDIAWRTTLDREPINPRPRAYAKIFRDLQQYAIGYITYSEGCNDDFNKVLWSSLGWDPDMKVEDILRQYSRYFISERYAEPFSRGLLGLEQNWVGPLKDNEGAYETLKLFQKMEKAATPQELLNWRFQQGLYRAYYDAYIKAKLHYETDLENQARKVLRKADEIGAIKAVGEAEAILDKAVKQKVKPEWRARVFELAEALFQSIRMQLSVKKYQAIQVRRGANLDNIDKPLNARRDLKRDFIKILNLQSEKERLDAIAEILD